MARVNRVKKNVAEVTLGETDPDRWGPDEALPGGGTRNTATSDGAYVCVTFLDGRPPQEHTLKSGATVTETPSGSIRIRGTVHP